MPGSSPTMARRCLVMRLKRVDFPTLGRPTMTTRGGFGSCVFYDSRRGAVTVVPQGFRTRFWTNEANKGFVFFILCRRNPIRPHRLGLGESILVLGGDRVSPKALSFFLRQPHLECESFLAL